jgi:signal transduction histidine kinase
MNHQIMIGQMTTTAEYRAQNPEASTYHLFLLEDSLTTSLTDHLPYEWEIVSSSTSPKALLRQMLKTEAPDAIIGAASPITLRYFERIATQYSIPFRPILVAISELPTKAMAHVADLCLPAQADWILAGLESALPRRAKQIATHKAWNAERHRQRRAARELELTKESIVRNVSHELRTPLLMIKSAVEKLERTEENINQINAAAVATARLEGLISNLTQFARGLKIELKPMNPQDAVSLALINLRNRWDYQAQLKRVMTDVEQNLPLVLGDSAGISNALQLLIENALKFSHDVIEVRAERVDEGVKFSVRDNGIGIPRHQRMQIFEPFFQGDSSITREHDGVGMGLTIVRFILDGHHVPIGLSSRKGKGSEFSFVLSEIDDTDW